MIRIRITDSIKAEIEKTFLIDMKKNKTGLFRVLRNKKIRKVLKEKYVYLYNLFYDVKGKIKEKEVENFLLADKRGMEKYISLFSSIDKKGADFLQENVFRYKDFERRNAALEVLEKLQVNVCPYCNRQYTFTSKNKKIKPQFDHYFPKSKYPYLAINLYNLIPSCSVCNSYKGAFDTFKMPILYPYEEEFNEKIKFVVEEKSLKAMQGFTDEFDIKIKDISKSTGSLPIKIDNQVRQLNLNILYERHKDYVQDIVKNYYINSPERIEELLKVFSGLYKSKEEIQQILIMNYLEKEDWGKRPLAKLTSDIYDGLDVR